MANITWIAVLDSNSLNVKRYGPFNSKEDVWSWINSKDPFRQRNWYALQLEDKERYGADNA